MDNCLSPRQLRKYTDSIYFIIACQGPQFTMAYLPSQQLKHHHTQHWQAILGYSPGYYKVRAAVVNSDCQEVRSSESDFAVSPLAAIPRPWNFNHLYPSQDHPYFAVIRANEYLGLNQVDQVIKELDRFYSPSAPQNEIELRLATAYYAKGNYQEVVEILNPLMESGGLEIGTLILPNRTAKMQSNVSRRCSPRPAKSSKYSICSVIVISETVIYKMRENIWRNH